ncbi:glycoside hydrolase family 5 protein, partial [Deinococcus misasensis]|uniref:glycoside hydrolase family 5 protein n=1 Tax=Deinococcus misasensis TaxID=392413 RepID=UPI000689B374
MRPTFSRAKLLTLSFSGLLAITACSQTPGPVVDAKQNAVQAQAVTGGFKVANGKLVDANGVPFIFQGINHPHAWYTYTTNTAIPAMRDKGANSVRLVLSSGCRGWYKAPASEVTQLIELAKSKSMVTVLEVHDTTGYGEDGAACTLDNAVNYWLEIKDALVGQEAYAIVNIGNEPYGNSNTGNWAPATKAAIQKLRTNGIKNTIMIDGPNWGQDWSNTMRAEAASIFNADVDKNLIFSIHMYEVYNTASRVNEYIDAFATAGLPLVVGEFANTHKGQFVDAATIMSSSKAKVNGYIGWSWSGNSGGVEALDMVNSFNASSPTTWGNMIFADLATSKVATVFDGPLNKTPTVAISSPTEGQSFASGSTVNVTATASDTDGTVSKVDFYVDGVLKLSDTTAPYTYAATGLTAGAHAIRAVATDNGGASSSVTRNITIQANAAPTLSVSTPTEGQNFATGTTVNVSATATDSDGVAKVEFFVDGVLKATSTLAPYSYAATGLTSGAHTVRVVATDTKGAASTVTRNITVGTVNTPPTLSVTSPTEGQSFAAGASINMAATATDSDGVARVDFYIDGVLKLSDTTAPY